MATGINKIPKPLSSRQAKPLLATVEFRIIAFILLHIPLAFFLDFSPRLGAIHGLAVLLMGLWAASRRQEAQVIAVLGYITGAEILWRMTGARIFWEYGKYASILLVLFAILVAKNDSPRRTRQPGAQLNPVILFYFAFLLPSLVLTFTELNLSAARDEISFNLSGPLALTVLALYLWQRPLSLKVLVYFLIALVAPIVSILTRAGWDTLTANALEFTLNANFVTSGGYGPNQVSNLLGLGALACVILLVLLWQQPALRLFFLGLAGILLFQAILTFSRGGVYSCILAAVVFFFHLLKSSQARGRFTIFVVFGLLLGWYVVIPFLDNITSTLWQARFTSLETTGRLELALADWQAFQEHPLVGVGVGVSKQYHAVALSRTITAHTEFSRTIAEHGLLGIVSFLILLFLLLINYRRAKPGLARALVAMFAVWSFSIMVHSAMRFVAISLVIALAMAAWQVSLDDPVWEER